MPGREKEWASFGHVSAARSACRGTQHAKASRGESTSPPPHLQPAPLRVPHKLVDRKGIKELVRQPECRESSRHMVEGGMPVHL